MTLANKSRTLNRTFLFMARKPHPERRSAGKIRPSPLATLAAALILLSLLLVNRMTAGILIPLAVDQLVESSEIVVFGSVQSKVCLVDELGRLYTKVEIQVAETWKGAHPEGTLITVVHGGGSLGNRRLVVSGQVNYQVGERVVAFLRTNPRGEAVTIAMCQGRFEVFQDPASIELYVRNTFHGGSPASGSNVTHRFPTQLPITLKELRRQVQVPKK